MMGGRQAFVGIGGISGGVRGALAVSGRRKGVVACVERPPEVTPKPGVGELTDEAWQRLEKDGAFGGKSVSRSANSATNAGAWVASRKQVGDVMELGSLADGPMSRLDESLIVQLCVQIQDAKYHWELRNRLQDRLGREPTTEEISRESERPIEVLLDAVQSLNAARTRLFEGNLGLVLYLANRFIGQGLSKADLVQEGSVGLLVGAEKFDTSRGLRFSTYVSYWIQRAMRRALSSKSRLIRVPEVTYLSLQKVRRYVKDFESAQGRPPTLREICSEVNIGPKRLGELLWGAANAKSVSLDLKVSEEVMLADLLSSDLENPDQRTTREMMQEDLRKAMSSVLSSEEQTVLVLKYGLEKDGECRTNDIAVKLGVTPQKVRQMELAALSKLRRHQHFLQDYLAEA